MRLVTKVSVSDLVHIGFWQKKGAINISMTEAKRGNAKICLTNCLKCKHKQRRSMKNIVLAWHMMDQFWWNRFWRQGWEWNEMYINRLMYTLHTVPKTRRYKIKSQHQEYIMISWSWENLVSRQILFPRCVTVRPLGAVLRGSVAVCPQRQQKYHTCVPSGSTATSILSMTRNTFPFNCPKHVFSLMPFRIDCLISCHRVSFN